MRKAHLPNPPQALNIRMIDDLQQQTMRNGYKTVHRIVENFAFTTVTSVHSWV
jgi:hypothetical protein